MRGAAEAVLENVARHAAPELAADEYALEQERSARSQRVTYDPAPVAYAWLAVTMARTTASSVSSRGP